MPSNHLILCHPLLLLPSVFPSIRVFSNESVLHIRWPKYWRFGISPSNEYSGLISFRMDWLDLFAVQGSLKGLPSPTPQFKSINFSLLSFLYGPILTSIESVMPSSHLILCHPLLLLPPTPPSIRVFSNESLFAWGGQSTGVSASASVLPTNTKDWSPLSWTGWISLQSKGLSRVFSNTTVQKHQFFGAQLSSQSNSHIHTWWLEKP